jgi:hypothetical protein
MATAKKKAAGYAGKGSRYLRREAEKKFATVTTSMKEELYTKVLGAGIEEVAKQSEKFALKLKTPQGFSGRNFTMMPGELIDTKAVGATTESTCIFSYRPNRTRRTPDTLYYEAVRNKKLTGANSANQQIVLDRNLALLEPPSGDTLANDDSYTNFSIRNEFDRAIKAKITVGDVGDTSSLKQNLILHMNQLTSVMILRAPSEGAIVDIYDLHPKFGIGPGTRTHEYAANDHISPQWCFSNGLTAGTGYIQGGDAYNFGIVWADPMESTTFRRTYNVIKKTTVRMASNAIHRHRLVFNINKSVTWDEMGQASSSGGTAPWLPTQMLVIRGYPSDTELAGAVSVPIQQESKLKYSTRLAQNTQVIVYNNNT